MEGYMKVEGWKDGKYIKVEGWKDI